MPTKKQPAKAAKTAVMTKKQPAKPAKKIAPTKANAKPTKTSAPTKKVAKATKKAVPTKKVASTKKAAPTKKVAATKKAAPTKKVASTRKAAPTKKVASTRSAKPAKKVSAPEKASTPETTAIVQAGGPMLVGRRNEYDGLTEDAKVELASERIRRSWVNATEALFTMGDDIVDAAYDGDHRAALASGADNNSIFTRIRAKLGTIEGGPNEKTLSLARRITAANRELTEEHFWKVVPYTHKELLVQLKEVPKMADGAKRVVTQGWSLKRTEKWVKAERLAKGEEVPPRGAPLTATRKGIGNVNKLEEKATFERAGRDYDKLDEEQKKKFQDEIDAAIRNLKRLRDRCR